MTHKISPRNSTCQLSLHVCGAAATYLTFAGSLLYFCKSVVAVFTAKIPGTVNMGRLVTVDITKTIIWKDMKKESENEENTTEYCQGS